MKHEYRVRWQRQESGPARRLYQTERGAVGCVEMLVALEDDKRADSTVEAPWERHYLHDLPDLIGPPTIEVRSVGEWEDYRSALAA